MESDALSYFLFGAALTIVLLGIIKYYYTKSRKDDVEEAKFRMLDDDDEM